MFDELGPSNRVRGGVQRVALAYAVGLCLLIGSLASGPASAQTSTPMADASPLPANWRDLKEGVGGYPAGPMLEIALRRTHADKLEMFKWRSEFIAMLSAQPGPQVEREWHSNWGCPRTRERGPGPA